MRALGLKLLDDSEQVADRTGQPIESDHHQGFAGLDFAKQPSQYWPGSIGPGRVFLQHRIAASGAKLVKLGIGSLLLGGNPRVAHKAAGEGGCPGFRRHVANRSCFEAHFYN